MSVTDVTREELWAKQHLSCKNILCHLVVLRLPERQQQGLDAVLLLHVEDIIIGVEPVSYTHLSGHRHVGGFRYELRLRHEVTALQKLPGKREDVAALAQTEVVPEPVSYTHLMSASVRAAHCAKARLSPT